MLVAEIGYFHSQVLGIWVSEQPSVFCIFFYYKYTYFMDHIKQKADMLIGISRLS